MKTVSQLSLLYCSLIILVVAGCAQQRPSIQPKPFPATLLISLDGFRHDYIEKYQPPFLKNFIKLSASLKSLKPSYPSKTFPNHLSIVTGMYPETHGIVANRFYAPKLDRYYKLGDAKSVTDGSFYSGIPIWNLAVRQNKRSGVYFWPGSEAEIEGTRPTYFETYDHGRPHQKRIDGILSWMNLPKEKRPHFMALYFHDVDSAGHKYGPNSKEVRDAIMKVDKSLSKLITKATWLNPKLHIIITSDHGMAEVSMEKSVRLDKDPDIGPLLNQFRVVGQGPNISVFAKSKDQFQQLLVLKSLVNSLEQPLKAYLRDEAPKRLHVRRNKRFGDLIIVAENGFNALTNGNFQIKGHHGYPPSAKDMHGIMIAFGPRIKNATYPTASNIHIYSLLAELLDLKVTHQIDGDKRLLQMLK